MTQEQFINHVCREQSSLRRFLTALCCGNTAEADDIAQETLMKAFLSLDRYDERGQFLPWLMKISYRVFLEVVTKRNQRFESIEKVLTQQNGTSADEAFRYQELHTALAQLSETLRTAIVLHYIQGYQIREIADITSASEMAVKKQLSRGRDQLKNILQR